MARLDVYKLPNGQFVLDIQAAMLERLATRVVVPLVLQSATSPAIPELNPVFDIVGVPHVMLTHAIASILTRDLRHPIASLARHHDAVTRALDILLLGY